MNAHLHQNNNLKRQNHMNKKTRNAQMKCPGCKNGQLRDAYLEEGLLCKTCDDCGGDWLLLEHYLRWKESCPAQETQVEQDIDVELSDSKKALICPISNTLMLKYRICKDSEHRLDLSPSVNGVWLDKGEWTLLKKSGLAGSLNAIFTAPWQRKIRSESSKDTFEQLYRRKFGDQDYDKIAEVRHWLDEHPQRDALRAFLIADNPWSAN